MPDSLLTPLPPTPSPVIYIPRSHGSSRVHSYITCLHLWSSSLEPLPVLQHWQYWLSLTSQTGAKSGGDSTKNSSSNEDKGEADVAYPVSGEELNLLT